MTCPKCGGELYNIANLICKKCDATDSDLVKEIERLNRVLDNKIYWIKERDKKIERLMSIIKGVWSKLLLQPFEQLTREIISDVLVILEGGKS